jgi:hypothetical protein
VTVTVTVTVDRDRQSTDGFLNRLLEQNRQVLTPGRGQFSIHFRKLRRLIARR